MNAEYLYDTIAEKLAYMDALERDEVRAAVAVAHDAHDGQRRKSGEPFVTHPVAVAGILADQRMDHETVIAGLLHDTVEDTDLVTFESIQERFGAAVRRIVEGETKVSKVSSSVSKQGRTTAADLPLLLDDSEDEDAGASASADGGANDVASAQTTAQTKANVQADDLQQMFLAMTQEVRVIVVKLADRTHNMRTLWSLKPDKRRRIAQETLLVFAPLAKLLGMYKVKNELEELAFMHVAPEQHAITSRWFDELSKRQEPVVTRAAAELQKMCDEDDFLKSACERVEIQCRAKELYGVYRKAGGERIPTAPPGSDAERESLELLSSRLRRVNEVAQLRIVLHLKDDAKESTDGDDGDEYFSGEYYSARDDDKDRKALTSRLCYHVLGIVHAAWPPVPGRMKDYIATPKLNGYKALHTVVQPIGGGAKRGKWGEGGGDEVFPLELQIRTEDMHRMAECGIAADKEVKAAWRTTARRTSRRLRRKRAALEGGVGVSVGVNASLDDGSDSSDSDDDDDARRSPAESVLIKSGHERQLAWLANIREWQEEFLGVLTAEEFVDTITGDLLGRRVFVFTPEGGVMNLPAGSTVVDYAYYTDVGVDMIAAKVNGVDVDADYRLSNADVVEIIATENSGLELFAGAGEASASAVARAVAKQKVALQKGFFDIAKTRSAKYKIQKFLAENGDVPRTTAPALGAVSAAAPNSEVDVILNGARNDVVRAAAAAMARDARRDPGASLSKYSTATVSLLCEDKDGLLAEISDVITRVGECGIVNYSGKSAKRRPGDTHTGLIREFQMIYEIELDRGGDVLMDVSVDEDDDADSDAATRAAEERVVELDARLDLLLRALKRHESVISAQLFCGLPDGGGGTR